MRVERTTAASEAMAKAVAQIKRAKLHVGWFDTAQYEDGTPVAYVATIQEFGSSARGIPPRPFMRPTIDQQRSAWRDSIAAGMRTVLAGKRTAREVLERVGMLAAGNVSETIAAVTSPALSPVTLEIRALKKQGVKISRRVVATAAEDYRLDGLSSAAQGVSNKPLVDTGLLIQSVDSKVTD